MEQSFTAKLIEFFLLFIPGAICALIGFRYIGKKEGVDQKFDAWYAKFGKYLKWGGSFLVIYSAANLLVF